MRRALAALLAALLALGGVAIAVTSTDDGNGRRTATVRVSVPAHAPQGDLNTPGTLNAPTAPATVRANAGNVEQLLPARPAAGAQTYSCRKVFGGHLWSSRGGKPTEFVVHYTAGNGTPASIDSYFRRTRAASATYIMSLDGRDCIQEVPESQKPWTQLGANRYAISIELVTTGYNLSRDDWLKSGIFQRGTLAALMRDSMRRNGIPLRFVDPAGCNFPPGWTDHNHLECENNHTDVAPTFPFDVLQRQLTDSGAAPQAPSKRAVALCRELNHYRRAIRAGHISRAHVRRAGAVKAALTRHHYVCGHHGRRDVLRRR